MGIGPHLYPVGYTNAKSSMALAVSSGPVPKLSVLIFAQASPDFAKLVLHGGN